MFVRVWGGLGVAQEQFGSGPLARVIGQRNGVSPAQPQNNV